MIPLPKLSSDVFLAPMAKITDVAYRALCKEYGAGLAFTEMISANDLSRNDPQALHELQQLKFEPKPRCVQLYGHNMENFITATKMVEPYAEIIDLNFGCPYYKLVRQRTCSALLAYPDKIQKIVQNIVANVKVPVTCKIRLGLDPQHITVMKVIQACEQAGASMITVHPRTTNQEYRGRADWSWIKKVKQNVKIPICGNGDVRTVEDYIRMKKETNCDYVMIGRGAIGMPLLFKQIQEYNSTGTYTPIKYKDKLIPLNRYIEIAQQYKLEFPEIKHQVTLMLERIYPDKLYKSRLFRVNNLNELKRLLESMAPKPKQPS